MAGGRRLQAPPTRRWLLRRLVFAGLGLAALLAVLVVPVGPGTVVLRVAGEAPPDVRRGPALVLRNPLTTDVVPLDLDARSVEAAWQPPAAGPVLEIRVAARPDVDGDPRRLLSMLADPASALGREVDAARRRLAEGPDWGADAAREVLRAALREGAWRPVTLEVLAASPVPDLSRHDTGLRVILVGIDAADWDRIDPLEAAGRLPNLRRLREGGAWATLRSDSPSLSPLLWTTAATGRPPDEHGIIDFVMLDPDTDAPVPISSRFRQVKAFWNILSEAGLSVAVVGWWATWPPEPVEGVLVSDRLAYSLFRYEAGDGTVGGVTYPESYRSTAASLKVEAWELSPEEVRPLARFSEEEFRRSTERLRGPPREGFEEHLDSLRRTLAATLTYHRIGLDLLRRGQPRVLAVYYQGLDEVNHRFAHLAGAPHPLATEDDRDRYGGAVDAFYELQDRLLGELVDAAEADSVVMVMSDHGFASGPERPQEFLPYVEAGRPGRWHTLDGIWILAGPVAVPGRLAEPVRLAQITPTLLRLLGLPVAEDMSGEPVESALGPAFRADHPATRIATYETGGRSLPEPAPDEPFARDEVLSRLRALGYLAPGGEGSGGGDAALGGTAATYHANLGAIRLGRGDLDGARAAFREALERSDNLNARAGLIQIHILQGRPEQALESTLAMFEETRGYDPIFYDIAAELFARTGRIAEGLATFRDLAARTPDSPHVQTALGILLQKDGRLPEAADRYRRALDQRPDSLNALQELFLLEEDPVALLGRISAAIERSPGAVMPYNWQGLVLRRLGRTAEAERSFRQALERDPASVRTLVNLSSLLVDGGRPAEAIPLLRRAIEGAPGAREPRVNLVVALGRTGRLQEARTEFEAAGGADSGSTDLLNAMAFASYLNDAPAEARSLLERSLSIDPAQPDARTLLGRLDGVD